MRKSLFKIFLMIPIIAVILMAISTSCLTLYILPIIEDIFLLSSLISKLIINCLIILIDTTIYFVMYRIILLKCNFSSSVSYFEKTNWELKKDKLIIINQDKLVVIFILSCTVIGQIAWYFFYKNIQKILGISEVRENFIDISYLIIPVFEELIFRKIYFDYCEAKKISYSYIINVIVFVFSHIIPLPMYFFIAILLTYSYKRYHSLYLNIAIHLIFNAIGLFLPLLMK